MYFVITDKDIKTTEDEILGGSSPLYTIMMLSIGPLIFAFFNGIGDTIDFYFIQKGFNQDGVTIVNISSWLRALIALLFSFCGNAATIKTAELLTKYENEKMGRLFVESIRLGIIIGIIFPFVFLFSCPKILPLLGMPKGLEADAIKYLAPIFCYPGIAFLNSIFAGELIAIGHSILSAIFQLIALCISLACDPLFIWIFNCKISMMGIAFITGPTIVCIVMLILFVAGKFTVKPVWYAFKEKPSQEFWDMLKLSIPMIALIVFSVICPLLIVGLITKISKNINEEETIPVVFATTMTAYKVLLSCSYNALSGLLPAATWAFHKKNLNRFIKLIYSSYILPYIVLAVMWPLMCFFPNIPLKLWIDDPDVMKWAQKISPVLFYTKIIDPINMSLVTLLTIMHNSGKAVLGVIIKNVILLSSSIALYTINKNSPRTVLFSAAFEDVTFLICNGICYFFVFKKWKQEIEDGQFYTSLISESTRGF